MFAVCSPHSAIEANSFIRLAGQLVFFASIKCVNFFVCGSVYVLNGETRSLLSSALQSSHTCLALRRRFSSRKQSFLPQAHAQVATDGADLIPHFWRRAATHFRRVRCKHTTAPSVTSLHVLRITSVVHRNDTVLQILLREFDIVGSIFSPVCEK